MKSNKVFVSLMVLTVVVESTLMFLVYQKVGDAKLGSQLIRLAVQMTFFLWYRSNQSKTPLWLLTGFHVYSALQFIYSPHIQLVVSQVLMVYHSIMVFAILFHDWFEEKIFKL